MSSLLHCVHSVREGLLTFGESAYKVSMGSLDYKDVPRAQVQDCLSFAVLRKMEGSQAILIQFSTLDLEPVQESGREEEERNLTERSIENAYFLDSFHILFTPRMRWLDSMSLIDYTTFPDRGLRTAAPLERCRQKEKVLDFLYRLEQFNPAFTYILGSGLGVVLRDAPLSKREFKVLWTEAKNLSEELFGTQGYLVKDTSKEGFEYALDRSLIEISNISLNFKNL